MQNTIEFSAVPPGILEILLWIVGGLLGLVGLICAIIVIVKMFQNDQTAMGIVTILLFCLGIGQFVTLIIGWMKSTEWNIKNMMLVYTVAFFLGPALVVGGYVSYALKFANANPQFQEQLDQMEMDLPEIEIE